MSRVTQRQARAEPQMKRDKTSSIATSLPSVTLNAEFTARLSGPEGHHLSRQLINKERKGRQGLVAQEAEEYIALSRQAAAAVHLTEAFQRFHQQNTEAADWHKRTRAQWDSETLRDQMRRVAATETAERQVVEDRYQQMWRTMTHLFTTEGQPLFAERARTLLIEAEEARREFLYREEVTAGLLLPLPGYQPLYVGSLRQGAAAMNAKVDFMSQQPCPFRFGEHCPYFPRSILKRDSAATQMMRTEQAARTQRLEHHHVWLGDRRTHGATSSTLALRDFAAYSASPVLPTTADDARSPVCACGASAATTTAAITAPKDRAAASRTSPQASVQCRAGPLPPPSVKLPPVAVDGHVQMSTYAFLSKPHYHLSESCLTKIGKGRM